MRNSTMYFVAIGCMFVFLGILSSRGQDDESLTKILKNISPLIISDLEAAILADAAYNIPIERPADYTPFTDKAMADWQVEKVIDQDYVKTVFFSKEVSGQKYVVMAVAGTRPRKNVRQTIHDLRMDFTGVGYSYTRSLERAAQYHVDNDKPVYAVVGHSLGGGVAEYVSTTLGVRGWAFNARPLEKGLITRLEKERPGNVARANAGYLRCIDTNVDPIHRLPESVAPHMDHLGVKVIYSLPFDTREDIYSRARENTSNPLAKAILTTQERWEDISENSGRTTLEKAFTEPMEILIDSFGRNHSSTNLVASIRRGRILSDSSIRPSLGSASASTHNPGTLAAPNLLKDVEPPRPEPPRRRNEWDDIRKPVYWGGGNNPPPPPSFKDDPPDGPPPSAPGGVLLKADIVKDQPADTSDLLGSE